MKIRILVLIALLLSACSPKIAPSVDRTTSDSIHVSEKEVDRKVPVTIPGTEVSLEGTVVNNSMEEISVKSQNTTLKVKVDNGKVQANCKTDSLEHLLDVKDRQIEIYASQKVQEKITLPPVYIEKTPTLTLWLSWIGIAAIIYIIIRLVIKLYLPKLP